MAARVKAFGKGLQQFQDTTARLFQRRQKQMLQQGMVLPELPEVDAHPTHPRHTVHRPKPAEKFSRTRQTAQQIGGDGQEKLSNGSSCHPPLPDLKAKSLASRRMRGFFLSSQDWQPKLPALKPN
jgi:hypothetical protein